MAHWAYILAVASGPAAFAAWRLARALLLVVGALTKNEQISRQCERMFILTRRDAKELLRCRSALSISHSRSRPQEIRQLIASKRCPSALSLPASPPCLALHCRSVRP